MDVAFVSNVVYPFVTGGAEKRIYEIGTRLAERDHSVTVYGRHYWDGPSETVYDGLQLHGVSPPRDLYTEGGRRSITEAIEFGKDVLRPLRRSVAEHDVIVASVFPYFPVLAAELAVIGSDTPLVTTWHEVWRDYWKEYLGRLGIFGAMVEQVTARVPQYPIAVSQNTADKLAELGRSREQIRIIPNGIDYEGIQATEPAENGFEVLFVGRLIEPKRVEMLLSAFDALNTDATLGIIGEGPQQEALERQAATLESEDRITFCGFIEDHEEVIAQMRAARVFVSPSVREGFGVTYIEAMAAGCTVIGTKHPNSAAAEVIGDAGFTISPTRNSLREVLRRGLNGERPSKSPQAAAKQFDWGQITTNVEDAYLDIVK
ncbi:glycosyltransferase family 1 protein [Halonotius terrestris]|uniref:Glycosyltransferase family 1 protein n=1 Tax=Halonotius terrestris TaxID=2487750 RepID=A0A8J8P971_9EURY|nr:glycosyltransferase family 4 protein [Halonotius terrestris]TQQ83368.1 glycosyltransferase family 1 protein [Halonotius terrestris]